MADFEPAFLNTLKWEGGLVDSKDDPGGITNFGISLRFLRARNPEATPDTIKALTMDDARIIYLDQFWLPNEYGKINSQKLADKIFDLSVNIGALMANEILQKSVNLIWGINLLKVDGNIGPKSLIAINACEVMQLYATLKTAAKLYYLEIIAKNPKLSTFKNGWIHRCDADA